MERERVAEAASSQLSATVDKLLAESQDRLQEHYREKMLLVEDRNRLASELDHIRKLLEDALSDKVSINFRLRAIFLP